MDIQFQPPKVISYACEACGDCCTNDFIKPLSDEEKNHIRKLYPGEPFYEKRKDGKYCLHSSNNGCFFLKDTGTCQLHEEHGLESKPAHCRRFPYSLQKLDNTVYIGYSFACQFLKPFPSEPDRKEWPALYEEFKKNERLLPSSIEIFPDLSIPAELYLQMENYFSIFLQSEQFSLDFPTRLIGIHVFFSMLKQFIRLDENKGRPFDNSCALFLSGLGQTNFKTIVESSYKLSTSEKKRYRRYWWFICDHLHSLAQHRSLSGARKIFTIYRQLFRSGAQFKKYQDIPVQPDWNHPLFRSFYLHLWERKEFLHHKVDMFTLAKYFLILCGVIAVRYKHLILTGNDITPDKALKESLKFVELHYGYHVRDKHLIIEYPRLQKYLALLDKSPLSVTSLFYL